ncbi:hypothetical protein MPSEU_000987500 [Mayamaea pseudoterrestris]|nr:hypothetical protein MPSEU_000987500 [Mayamaea pseudoterrestris]
MPPRNDDRQAAAAGKADSTSSTDSNNSNNNNLQPDSVSSSTHQLQMKRRKRKPLGALVYVLHGKTYHPANLVIDNIDKPMRLDQAAGDVKVMQQQMELATKVSDEGESLVLVRYQSNDREFYVEADRVKTFEETLLKTDDDNDNNDTNATTSNRPRRRARRTPQEADAALERRVKQETSTAAENWNRRFGKRIKTQPQATANHFHGIDAAASFDADATRQRATTTASGRASQTAHAAPGRKRPVTARKTCHSSAMQRDATTSIAFQRQQAFAHSHATNWQHETNTASGHASVGHGGRDENDDDSVAASSGLSASETDMADKKVGQSIAHDLDDDEDSDGDWLNDDANKLSTMLTMTQPSSSQATAEEAVAAAVAGYKMAARGAEDSDATLKSYAAAKPSSRSESHLNEDSMSQSPPSHIATANPSIYPEPHLNEESMSQSPPSHIAAANSSIYSEPHLNEESMSQSPPSNIAAANPSSRTEPHLNEESMSQSPSSHIPPLRRRSNNANHRRASDMRATTILPPFTSAKNRSSYERGHDESGLVGLSHEQLMHAVQHVFNDSEPWETFRERLEQHVGALLAEGFVNKHMDAVTREYLRLSDAPLSSQSQDYDA